MGEVIEFPPPPPADPLDELMEASTEVAVMGMESLRLMENPAIKSRLHLHSKACALQIALVDFYSAIKNEADREDWEDGI